MTQPTILGTGLNGLIGSKLVNELSGQYQFDVIDISHPDQPVDITDYTQVVTAFEASSAQTAVHFAAYTNVTGAWDQRGDKSGLAYQVNVVGTENIVKAAQATGKHLIHISTAYVFNGQKMEPYLETDQVDPIEWYGQTKAWAEEKVQAADCPWTILRIDQPFRLDSFARLDLAHSLIEKLKADTLHPLFTDHYFGPTLIEDFVKIIQWATESKVTGVFHASSGEQWTDYEFGQALKAALNLAGTIKPGSLETYQATLNRPYQQNTALNTEKLTAQLPFQLTPIKTALAQINLD